MKKPDFVSFLESTLEAVKADDSAEGRIAYQWAKEPGTFNVDAAVRVGNSMGQGSVMMVQEKLDGGPGAAPEPDQGGQEVTDGQVPVSDTLSNALRSSGIDFASWEGAMAVERIAGGIILGLEAQIRELKDQA